MVVFSEELSGANSWGVFQLGTADATADVMAGDAGGGGILGIKVATVIRTSRVLESLCTISTVPGGTYRNFTSCVTSNLNPFSWGL